MNEITRRRAARNASRLMSGGVTADEARGLNPWSSSDEDYRHELLTNLHMLGDLDALEDDEELLSLVEDAQPKARSTGRLFGRAWVLALAASVLMAVSLTFWWEADSTAPEQESMLRYVTRIGEVRQVDLADGSSLHLNTGSEALVSITDERRRIILQRGEAYFDVQADASRPFVVEAGGRSVTVLGTEFTVRKKPDSLQVSVVEGLVAVNRSEDIVSANAKTIGQLGSGAAINLALDNIGQINIGPGWVAEFNERHKTLVGLADDQLAEGFAWRTGILRFDRLPLVDIVKELNRYSAKKILIEDASVMNIPVYVVIKIDQIDTALKGLENSLPIAVTRDYDRIVITASKR